MSSVGSFNKTAQSGQEYTPDITREQIISYIKQMKELASAVLPYNKYEADMYLGEGILFLYFTYKSDK